MDSFEHWPKRLENTIPLQADRMCHPGNNFGCYISKQLIELIWIISVFGKSTRNYTILAKYRNIADTLLNLETDNTIWAICKGWYANELGAQMVWLTICV